MESILNIIANKKTVAVLLVLGIVLLGIILFAGRGGSTAADLAGSYEIESLNGRGENSIDQESLDAMKDSGMTITLELTKDGNGILDIFGQAVDVTCDTEAMTMEIEGSQEPFTYEDGKLTINRSGTDMVFVRE